MLDEERLFQEELLGNYDLQLGVSENPDANFLPSYSCFPSTYLQTQ